jgi:ribosomal protein L11 methyltransferase
LAIRIPRPEFRDRLTYSRVRVPGKSGDDAVLGLLALHDPLGFENAGQNLVAFYREAGAARNASHVLRQRRIRHELTTDIPEGDPLEAFRAASRPFAVGRRLWIDPGDQDDGAPPRGRIALRVPASRAFGTGSHASTRLALTALEDEALESRTLLDVGTGSGVLALAAAAFGIRRAVGLDTDPEAVFVARENLRRHAFGGRVRLFVGSVAACAGQFDFVVANMLADEILPESRRLMARAGRRGRIIISGVTREREPEVLRRMRTGRWKLAGRRTEREWACLCLARG